MGRDAIAGRIAKGALTIFMPKVARAAGASLMRSRNIVFSGAIAALALPTPALADVKTGIDAYQRGDFASAVGAWRPLAVAGDADAQYNMGQAYRLGRGVPVDPQMAESWFKRAADQGHERARNAYGLTLFQNGRRKEAIPFIEEAAGNNFPQSQYVYATLLFNGDMVEKDWVRAYALMTRAAAADVGAAKAGLEQLNKYIPIDQRERGLRLAQVFDKAADRATDPVGTPVSIKALPKPSVSKAPAVAAAQPTPPSAVGGIWRVQLGAFSSASTATALWTRLRSRIDALEPYTSFNVPAGAVTRLQAGPLTSRASADRLCAAVKAGGNACFVVAP